MKTKYIATILLLFFTLATINTKAQGKVYERYCKTNLFFSPDQTGASNHKKTNVIEESVKETNKERDESQVVLSDEKKDPDKVVPLTEKTAQKTQNHEITDTTKQTVPSTNDSARIIKLFQKLTLFMIHLLLF